MAASTPGVLRPAMVAPDELSVRRASWLVMLRRNPRLAIGGGLVLALVLVAIGAPLLTHYDPVVGDVSDSLVAPGASHWLGT
ncbi:MAG TPA: D,D-dipeptide ABC transporter permease, partial [Chloroflexota bacterium]|nr:D,D-dipeptide ABC transporter permease [Chloroflexota bacterium]